MLQASTNEPNQRKSTSLFQTLLRSFASNETSQPFTFRGETYLPRVWPHQHIRNKLVVICQQVKSQQLFVFKVIKRSESDSHKIDGETKQDVMSKINRLFHSNLLSIQTFEMDSGEFVVLTDYRGLDLEKIREQKVTNGEKITVLSVLMIFIQVLTALRILHKENLVHRDIKLRNIFMDGDLVVLGDFGSVTNIRNNLDLEYLSSDGSEGFLPPEIVVRDRLTYKWDMWSLAITILKFMFGNDTCDFVKEYILLEKDNYESESAFVSTVHNRIDHLFTNEMDCLEDDIPSWFYLKTILLTMLTEEERRIDVETLVWRFFGGDTTIGTNPSVYTKSFWIKNKNIVDYIYSLKSLAINDNSLKNREIVLEMVKKNGLALERVESYFRMDKEIVIQAIMQTPVAYFFASEELKKDEQVIELISRINLFDENSDNISTYSLKEAIQKSASSFRFVNERQDRNLMLDLVKLNGLVLEFVDEQFKKDIEIVTEAVKQNGRSIRFLHLELFKEQDLITQLITYQNALDTLKTDGKLRYELSKHYNVYNAIFNPIDLTDSSILKLLVTSILQIIKVHEENIVHGAVTIYNIDDGVLIDRKLLHNLTPSLDEYLPPETLAQNRNSISLDIWSLAITMLKFIFRNVDINFNLYITSLKEGDLNEDKYVQLVLDRVDSLFTHNWEIETNPNFGKELQKILNLMLTKEERRISSAELLYELMTVRIDINDLILHNGAKSFDNPFFRIYQINDGTIYHSLLNTPIVSASIWGKFFDEKFYELDNRFTKFDRITEFIEEISFTILVRVQNWDSLFIEYALYKLPKSTERAYVEELFNKNRSLTQCLFILNTLTREMDIYIHKAVSKLITPIYYKKDNSGWYWSPDKENWMPSSTEIVNGGIWNGQSPAKENIDLIRWLNNEYSQTFELLN